MGLISGMSLAQRLLLGFGAMLLLLVGMALLSLTRMNDLSATLERITVESASRNQAIGSLNQGIGGYVQALGGLGSADLEQGAELLRKLNGVVAQYVEAERRLESLLPDDSAVRRLFDDVRAKGVAAREVIAIGIEKAEGRGDSATAFYIRAEYSGAIDKWNSLQQAWASAVAGLSDWSQKADAELAAATNASARHTQLLIVGGGLVTVLLGGTLALWIIRDTQRAIGAAVANALEHAAASRVVVFVEAADDGSAFASVSDDGVGFDPVAPRSAESHGIAESIKGRIESIGGRVEIRSAPGKGTEVLLWSFA